jgi:ABC-type oligopeptide transport system ATPase subunit
MNENGNNLISLQNLQVHYDLGGGGLIDRITGGSKVRRVVKAVDGVSLDIKKGETLGLSANPAAANQRSAKRFCA